MRKNTHLVFRKLIIVNWRIVLMRLITFEVIFIFILRIIRAPFHLSVQMYKKKSTFYSFYSNMAHQEPILKEHTNEHY